LKKVVDVSPFYSHVYVREDLILHVMYVHVHV